MLVTPAPYACANSTLKSPFGELPARYFERASAELVHQPCSGGWGTGKALVYVTARAAHSCAGENLALQAPELSWGGKGEYVYNNTGSTPRVIRVVDPSSC